MKSNTRRQLLRFLDYSAPVVGGILIISIAILLSRFFGCSVAHAQPFTGAFINKDQTITEQWTFDPTVPGPPFIIGSNAAEVEVTDLLAEKASALASPPTQCAAGNYPLGIAVDGDAQSCTADDDTPDDDSEVPDTLTHSGGSIALESLTVTAIGDDEFLLGTGSGTAAFSAIPNCDDTTGKLDFNGTAFTCVTDGGGGSGTSVILDLSDDDVNESTALTELATSGDTNSIFTEPAADKLLINLANNWPTADDADDVTCTGCVADAELATDFIAETELDTRAELIAQITDLNSIVQEENIDTQAELEALITDATNLLDEGEIDASAELAAIMDDETGTGALVFADTPQLSQIGVGGPSGTRQVTVQETTTAVLGQLAILQSGTGDATIDLSAGAKVWTFGIDNSDSDIFKLSDDNISADVGAGTKLSVDASANLQIYAAGDLRLADSDSSNYAAIQSPTTITSNYTLTLPTDDGDANEFLQTDGSGTLTWAAAGGGGTDSVGTDELDDDANSPTAGDIVIVETGAASFDYLTPNAGTNVTADLEEETHASEHAENAADEILGESLGTACSNGEVLKANASGGLDCAADATGGGGSPVILDLADDSSNESTDITEIATTGDTNSIFTEPLADKLLIDVSQNWPTADSAAGLVCTDCVTLTTETVGNYVASITNGTGITGGNGGSEGAALTLAATLGTSIDTTEIVDDTVALADVNHTITLAGDPVLAGGQAFWGANGIIFEGNTANTIEGLLTTDPATTDKTWTLPDATGTLLIGPGSNGMLARTAAGVTTARTITGTSLDITVTNGDGLSGNPTLSFPRSATLAGNPAITTNSAVIGTNGIVFEGSSADTIETLLTVANPTSTDKTITLPNVTGTVITTGDTGTVTGTMILNDTVALTTDTAGNYVASITNGTGITGGDGGSEGATLTLAATLGTSIDTSEIVDDTIDFADLKQDNTLAGNPALLVDECFPFATTSGGGFICEGSTADTSEQAYLFPDVNGADTTNRIVVHSAEVTSVTGNALTVTTGTLNLEIKDNAEDGVGTTSSVSGLEFESAELTLLQGCSDGQLLKWVESTDTWDCSADAGGGSGAFSDAADPVVLNTTTKDVQIGDTGIGALTGKLEIGGDADQPQLIIEGHSTQTDSIVIVQNDADTQVATIENDGTIFTAVGLDAIGASSLTIGSADVTAVTVTTNGTGDAEFILPADSIGASELDSTTGAYDFGGVSSLELPNAAAPTTDAAGEIALDTTITDHQPLLQYYDGGENMTVIAVDTTQLPATDNEIIVYDAATDKFVFEANTAGGFVLTGGGPINSNIDHYNGFGVDANNQSTEERASVIVPAMTCTNIRAFVATAPGSGKQWDIYMRKDFVSSGSACSITDTNTECTVSTSVSFNAGDRLNLLWDAVNTPAGSGFALGYSITCSLD